MATTGLTSQSVPNVLGGISKMSPLVRAANELENIDNGYFMGTEGLVKRPPLIMLKDNVKEGMTHTSKPYVFPINRGDGNEYIGVIHDGTIEIIDVNNPTTPQTVNVTNGSYLNTSGTPRTTLRSLTIMDYTIILNTEKVTEYLPYYTDNQQVGSMPSPGVVTDEIHDIVQLFTDLPAINSSHDGKTLEIVGDMSVTTDNYYVKGFHQATNPEEVWRETRRPNILYRFDNTTLPHVLKKTGGTAWSFEPIIWNDRLVGDEISNPSPSFMSKYTRTVTPWAGVPTPVPTYFYIDAKVTNRRISDLVFFQDRLAFCSDEYVCFSRAGDYFNFWHHSATTLNPDDPIDVSALSQKVSKIHAMTPFSRSLILSSAQTQHILTSNGALTPTTVSITTATDYDASIKVKPVTLGSSLFIPAKQSGYFRLNQYFLFEGQTGYLANNIAEAVDTFVPQDVDVIEANSMSDTLFCFSTSTIKNIYVYKVEYEDNKRKTSAWARWNLPDNILGMTSMNSALYVITQKDSHTYLGKLDMAPANALVTPDPFSGQEQPGYLYEFDIHLDHRETVSSTGIVYDPVTKKSTVTVPFGKFHGYSTYEGKLAVVRQDTGEDLTVLSTGVSSGDTTLLVDTNLTGITVFTGVRYETSFELSPIYYRGTNGSSVTNVTLKLRNLGISYGYSGMFQVDVTPYKRDTYTYTYSGITVGSFVTGRLGLTTGIMRVPVMSDAKTVQIVLKDSSVYPCSFLGYDWQGMYAKKA